jgi:transcriptional regulator with XRE-family HTH domain
MCKCWKTTVIHKIIPNGSEIRKCRIKWGWTLRGLAEFMGISPSYLSKIENGKISHISESVKQLFIICGFVGENNDNG